MRTLGMGLIVLAWWLPRLFRRRRLVAQYVGGPLCGVTTELHIEPPQGTVVSAYTKLCWYDYVYETATGTHGARWRCVKCEALTTERFKVS